MAKKPAVRLSFNPGALRAVRMSKAAQDATDKVAADILANAQSLAGEGVAGFATLPLDARVHREAASVIATGHARRHDAKHHTLLRAMKGAM